MKKVVLCSGSKCCPEALINGDMITIKDDDGGTVNLTKEQVKILWENLQDRDVHSSAPDRSGALFVIPGSGRIPPNPPETRSCRRGESGSSASTRERGST